MTLDIAQLTRDEAAAMCRSIRVSVEDVREKLITLWTDRAWLVMGYRSWSELCSCEFGTEVAALMPKQERRALVADLSEQGMSTRAIGSALGIGNKTVARDIARVSTDTPATDQQQAPSSPAAAPIPQGVGAGPEEPANASGPASQDQPSQQPSQQQPRDVTIGLDGRTYPRPAPKALPRAKPREKTDADKAMDWLLSPETKRFIEHAESLAGLDHADLASAGLPPHLVRQALTERAGELLAAATRLVNALGSHERATAPTPLRRIK